MATATADENRYSSPMLTKAWPRKPSSSTPVSAAPTAETTYGTRRTRRTFDAGEIRRDRVRPDRVELPAEDAEAEQDRRADDDRDPDEENGRNTEIVLPLTKSIRPCGGADAKPPLRVDQQQALDRAQSSRAS